MGGTTHPGEWIVKRLNDPEMIPSLCRTSQPLMNVHTGS